MNKLFLYGLMAAISLSIGLLIACSSSSSSNSDDDTSPTLDDDAALTCTEVYTQMYTTCALKFENAGGGEIPLAQVIASCEGNLTPYGLTQACGSCVVDNYQNCSAMNACLAGCVGGSDDDASPAH
jgi:hypothetical protein